MQFKFNTRLRLGAVIIRDGKVLGVKPCDYRKYILPGGAIEFGESPEECFKREVKEELQCNFVSARFFGAYYSKEKGVNRVTAAFLVNNYGKAKT